MKIIISILLFYLVLPFTYGQDVVLPLWTQGVPCANDHEIQIENKDIGAVISKVHAPDIAVYKANHPTGTAVLICPGGGYTILAYDWEGTQFAKWFNEIGITAIVLKSRLPHWESAECRDKVALADAQRAMRMIRKHAKDWDIDADKIGVMGFSAGGHLASTLSTHYDNGYDTDVGSLTSFSCRPDFSILVYPVISMDTSFTHMGSRTNLIGKDPLTPSVLQFSNELHITDDTPPTLLVHATDDKAVPVENSLRYYQNLVKHDVPASLLIYESGGHGFGMAENKEGAVKRWLDDCKSWLTERRLIED